jgi:hypothetical protein
MDRNDKKHLGIRMIILDCFKKSEIYQDDLFRCADLFEQQIAQAKKEAYAQACEDCSGAIGKLAIHLLKQSQESEV